MTIAVKSILDGRCKIHIGDCIEAMRAMPANSVDCVVTSPPYWGLRSYSEQQFQLNPNLSPEKKAWIEAELIRRGIHAEK